MTQIKRIAAEEAWAPPEILQRYRRVLEEKPASWDPGFHSLWGFFLGSKPRATALARRIQTLGDERLADMDSSGIAMQLVFLTAPGVQVFDSAKLRGGVLARKIHRRRGGVGKRAHGFGLRLHQHQHAAHVRMPDDRHGLAALHEVT